MSLYVPLSKRTHLTTDAMPAIMTTKRRIACPSAWLCDLRVAQGERNGIEGSRISARHRDRDRPGQRGYGGPVQEVSYWNDELQLVLDPSPEV
jgi:hypothetical protein